MAVVISDRLLESSDRLLDAEPDEHLLRLARGGHEGAFTAIVRRYERELQAQARRLSSDGRGEDAVQQAFLNAFAALQRGAEIRHLRGWLHHILRNEIIRARVPLDVPLDAAVAYGESVEDTVQRRATAHATLTQLSALPDRQRDALLGTAVLGFPRAHVARTMGLSEGAVRQLVHRARLRLREAAGALLPFPLFKLFGAARSGIDAAPDAALGAGAAASGGLAIKVGALVASGVVATGIAVTQTFPPRHHAASTTHGARHHEVASRAPARVSPKSRASGSAVAASAATLVTTRVPLNEHVPAAGLERGRSHDGSGRLSGTRSGRHGGSDSVGGRDNVGSHEGASSGGGNDGSGRLAGGTSARGSTADQSGSRSGSGDSGQSSGSGRDGSGSASGGSDSGSGRQSDSGSHSTFLSGSGTSGSGSGGSGDSASGGGSSDGGGSSGGSGGGSTQSSGGSRDLSGSPDSSSS